MDTKEKIEKVFKGIEGELKDLTRETGELRILFKFDGEQIFVKVNEGGVHFNSLKEVSNEIISSRKAIEELLNGERALIDLLRSKELKVKGKLGNLMALLKVLNKHGIRSGMESSSLCQVLGAVFNNICNENEEVMKSVSKYKAVFELGSNEESCCLTIDSKFNLESGKCLKPVAKIYTSKETWEKIFNGEENIGMVAMKGKVKIEGNLLQAFKLKTIIDKII
jgi:putative sterol carrier protein